jgi:hypothetical protein
MLIGDADSTGTGGRHRNLLCDEVYFIITMM